MSTDNWIKYLDKYESGLPFDVIRDNHFPNFFARFESGAMKELTVSDIININLLMEIKRTNDLSNK